jgi:hypothetical protein
VTKSSLKLSRLKKGFSNKFLFSVVNDLLLFDNNFNFNYKIILFSGFVTPVQDGFCNVECQETKKEIISKSEKEFEKVKN